EVAIVVLAPDARMRRVNPYFGELVGRVPGELVNKPLAEFLVSEDRLSFQEALYRRRPGSPHARGVHRLATPDGSTRTIAWSARPLLGAGYGQSHTLLVARDITELQEAQDRAVQAERLAAIGQMVAGLAHESRNALQRSQACLTVLSLKLTDRPAEQELVARLQRAQDDLRALYDDVREYAAPVQLDRRLCRLPQIWREAWEDLAGLRHTKQAELHEEIGSEDWKCLADPFRLKQVFRNLLDNALAAGPQPTHIIIRCVPTEIEGEAAIQVAICDNGPGFASAQQLKAFEPFYTTKLQGTGLGLAICKRVVEAHGGHIRAGQGPGGKIILTLPRRRE
ncbi:MAG TPA: ATP-binding protein, partial [Gemmataceae bacterium]|nr:ATP-binding protein [Gemmataceae bacterium]